MTHIPMESMLKNLASDPRGAALAKLSVQTKVEKLLLAEIAIQASSAFPDYEFWLEERPRRDLTIRQNRPDGAGPLLEWIEAKMCYSDCLARHMTGRAGRTRAPRPHARADEYRELVAQDVARQQTCLLPLNDRAATLTVALFVFHRRAAHPRHQYYPGFRNRRGFTADEIRQEAIRYCQIDIAHAIQRQISEQVEVCLDNTTDLVCFFYSTPAPGVGQEIIRGLEHQTSIVAE